MALTVKISPIATGVHMVKTGISFVAERVKDEIGCKVNEDQEPLFKTVTKGRNEGGVYCSQCFPRLPVDG